MNALAAIVAGVAALAVLSWLHLRFWTRRLEPRRRYALVERIATEDGSAIELRRVGVSEVADIDRGEAEESRLGEEKPLPPVLLVHGIGIDHRNVDMFDGRSLVRALAGRGRDVWLLTLRSGLSGQSLRARSLVTFERMARHDLPHAVREVRRRTGASELDYLGFSMGGMLLYAGLALRTIAPTELRRVAVLGAPGRVLPHWPVVGSLARVWPELLMPAGWLALPSRMIAFVAGHLRTPIHTHIIEPSELSAADVGAALMTIRDIPRPLLTDFARFMRTGKIEIGGVEILPALANVRIPAVFVAGGGDRIASPIAVRAGYDAWGAAHPDVEKRWHVAGVASGAHADYGHGDLAFGIHAPTDVYPVLLDHLAAR